MIVTADFAIPEQLVPQLPPLPNGSTALGLLRTEFLFAGWAAWPTATDQLNAYKSVFSRTECRIARVRVFDISADKTPWASQQNTSHDGLSYLAKRPELLAQQLEMLIEAAKTYDVGLQVTTSYVVNPDDAGWFAALVGKLGLDKPAVMLETPAAVVLAEHYCSGYATAVIGLGDLVPLTFGLERGRPMAPSVRDLVLRGIERLIPAGHPLRTGAHSTAVCGAADVELASRVATSLESMELVIPYADLPGALSTRRG